MTGWRAPAWWGFEKNNETIFHAPWRKSTFSFAFLVFTNGEKHNGISSGRDKSENRIRETMKNAWTRTILFPEIWQRSDADAGEYLHPVCEDACLERALNSSVNNHNNHNGDISELLTLTPLTRRQRPNKQFHFCAATHVHVSTSICNLEWFVHGFFAEQNRLSRSIEFMASEEMTSVWLRIWEKMEFDVWLLYRQYDWYISLQTANSNENLFRLGFCFCAPENPIKLINYRGACPNRPEDIRIQCVNLMSA